MTTLKEYQEVLDEISQFQNTMDILNKKIISTVGNRYHILNSTKHLERSKQRIFASMKNKYGHLV